MMENPKKTGAPLPQGDPWAQECQKVWDEVIVQNSDISPSREENFRIFVSSYASLPKRLRASAEAAMLDLGCGTGFIAKVFSGRVRSVTGLDISPHSIELARQRNPDGVYIVGDMAAVPLPNAAFDIIVAITSLEFCRNKKQVLRETHRLLKDQGSAYFEVRNADFLPLSISAPLKNGVKYLGWIKPLPMATFEDFKHPQWLTLFDEAGFVVEQIYPSLRPWNYGRPFTRVKQSIIALVRALLPIRFHYMIGYRLRKK